MDPAVKPFGSTVKKEAGKVVETSEEKDEEFPREKDEEFPSEYWNYCVFKHLGTTVKKEVRIEVERWEKMVGYVA